MITDNKFQIQTFAAGETVPGLHVLDAVQNGTVEMGNTALYYYFGKTPAFTFGTALPFGLNPRQMISWIRFGGGEARHGRQRPRRLAPGPFFFDCRRGWVRLPDVEIYAMNNGRSDRYRVGSVRETEAAP